MIKNYFKIAFRKLIKNKGYSLINIGGLAVGMAVTMLIGLWIHKELSFNKNFENYDRIAQVWQHVNSNGEIGSQISNPYLMSQAIKEDFGSDFEHVLQSSWNFNHTLSYEDKIITKSGSFFEEGVVDMLSLNIIQGDKDGLKEIHSILLSETTAKILFGEENPIGKLITLDNEDQIKVTGVYEDIAKTSDFSQLNIILPWNLYLKQNSWIKEMENPWGSNFTQTFAQIAENADFGIVNAKIKNVKYDRLEEFEKRYEPKVFLHPMSKWHLYSKYENGVNIGGDIDNVKLFGLIGIFVLLLACINFINLSTARSEKSAKEVGIRKVIGSRREQLITQFFSESILISSFAFVLSIAILLLIIPYFNSITDSKINILWNNPIFWSIGIAFSILTGLIAGFYPALYLSSFIPAKVLKGTNNSGKNASLPRKILVISQFAISIMLIIGTMVVYQQIKHAQNRSLGYDKNGLITISTNEITHNKREIIRSKLIDQRAISEMTEALSPMTENWNTNGGIDWEGKDPTLAVDFPNNGVTAEFGKTVGWTIKEGRDFSKDFATDSSAMILNEASVAFMNLTDPVGKVIRWNDEPYTIIGIVKDMLISSPYLPIRPSLYHLTDRQENIFILKLNPESNVKESLTKIESVFKATNPAIPVDIEFVDEEFQKKFDLEKKVAKLSVFFTILAIFISCLGLFGLASYVAEQRTKEIGIRKVLGASVTTLWQMLSKDFIWLVVLACFIAVPIAYYFMHSWLQTFDYRTNISWWVFGLACGGALIITVITVSFQAIKAAIANPIKSLRTE